MKACLAYLRRSVGPTTFGSRVRDLFIADFRRPQPLLDGRVIDLLWPYYPHDGRRTATEAFLAHPDKPDILFWLDDDMDFTPAQFYAILKQCEAYPDAIIGGLYYTIDEAEGAIPRPIFMQMSNGIERCQMEPIPDGLHKVAMLGFGFTAIPRQVLFNWGRTNWYSADMGDGEFLIEDKAFFRRMGMMGITVYCDTRVKVGHLKVTSIGTSNYNRWLAEAAQ